MQKRVKFKNSSPQKNKRARLTHEEGVQVDIGNQDGAVYYTNPELGMCYSQPMEIECSNQEETQCLSLTGLYDVFIDGVRVGRALNQDDIMERVNAGNYGVEASPCLTVSCVGAPGKTNALTLTGAWDVEINDVRVIENASQERILKALRNNPLIRAEEYRPKCVSNAGYVFNIHDMPVDFQFNVGDQVIFLMRYVDPTGENPPQYDKVVIEFNDTYIDAQLPNQSFNKIYREVEDLESPWDRGYLIMALSRMMLRPHFQLTQSPENYDLDTSVYCKDGLNSFFSTLYVTNNNALTQSMYTYGNGVTLDFSNIQPFVHLRVSIQTGEEAGVPVYNVTELEPFTFDPTAQSKEECEINLLTHFKHQLETLGFTCELFDTQMSSLPPGFYSSEITITQGLSINAPFNFRLTMSRQWEGTSYHPELNNDEYGWDINSVGLTADGQTGYGSTVDAYLGECILGPATPEEVNYTVTISGFSEAGNTDSNFISSPAIFEILTPADEDISMKEGQIDITTLFRNLRETPPATSCGVVEQPSSEV